MLMTNLPSADLYLPPSSLKPCYFLWKTITPDRRDVSIPSEQIECIQAMMTETERKRPRPSELSTAVCLSATITLIQCVPIQKKEKFWTIQSCSGSPALKSSYRSFNHERLI